MHHNYSLPELMLRVNISNYVSFRDPIVVDPGSVAIDAAGQPVVLIGLPGSGKSRIGRLLAERIGWVFADIDKEIEVASGRSVAELVDVRGWTYFRDLEQQTLERLLEQAGTVIATGGGVVERAENREAIVRNRRVVWLRADQPLLLQRLHDDDTERPLLAGDTKRLLQELARIREPLYAQLSTYSLDTGSMTPEAAAERLAGIVGEERVRTPQ